MKNEQKQTILTGKVPAGYQQTEVGIIPKDWEVKKLSDISNFINGRAYSLQEWEKSGIPVIRLQNLTGRGVEYYYSNLILPEKQYCYYGDLLFMWSATFGPIIWKGEKAIYHYHIWKVECDKKQDTKHLYYLLSDMTEKLKRDSSNGGTMLHITKKEMESIFVPIPPRKEQTAIAEALSDVDSLLVSLEKLIEKKRAIKTGTMQQLLTGKKRLPAFAQREDGTPKGYKMTELGEIPEDWEVKTVFELANNQKELFNDGDWIESEHITSDGIRLLQTGNIGIGKFIENEQHKKYIFEESFFKLNCKPLRNGDILICRLADPAGRSCIYETDSSDLAITSVDVTIFRPDQNVDRKFFVQYFSSSEWFQSILQSVGGTTHKRISRGALGKILVSVPPLKEQTAIAEILSDMDAEIEALEAKRAKTEEIKQGMMQELLTGQTRLV